MSGHFQLEHVTAGYGRSIILRDVSMEIQPGEFCALLGLNGSGKTTLLRAICGLLPMREGRCLVNDQDCTNLNEYKRGRFLSYIPQRHSGLHGVTVLDVILMGLNPHLGILSSPSQSDRENGERLLAKMGIAHLTGNDFSALSEGQKQLVILTRALIQNAPVMLMDEPDSALDFRNRHRMLRRIRDLVHSESKAGLVTLHDPNFALAYCDRLLLLREGNIVSQLSLASATAGDIQDCLSAIYGDIEILEHNGRYMMLVK